MRLGQELEWLALPAERWSPPRETHGQKMLDVAIVGAGMSGLCAAAALMLQGIDNIQMFDRAPAGREGPWVTYARMDTLRTPKAGECLSLGLPSLTFRAWYQSQFGEEAWQALDKAPRSMWMDYLVWYRKVLKLPVRNDTSVDLIEPIANGKLRLHLSTSSARETVWARRVVLATGFDGFGGPVIPAVALSIDRQFWAHTSDDIDFGRLRGKRVGVIGVGASALDNAAAALEAGAERVDIFMRRSDMPAVQKLAAIRGPGLLHGFVGLPDAWKSRLLHYEFKTQNPAPRQSILRVFRHPNVHLHAASGVTGLAVDHGELCVRTPQSLHRVDFLIFGTGFCNDARQRPELAAVAPFIRLWRDESRNASPEDSIDLLNSPYLDAGFAFQERAPGICPGLASIHCITSAASMTHGRVATAVQGASVMARRLSEAICRSLFVEDCEAHFTCVEAYNVREFAPHEMTAAS
jgi:cation diffusion facilitator CzcD-associated flavoprotein CzcO